MNAEGNGTEKLVVPFKSNNKFRAQLEKLSSLDPSDKGILKVFNYTHTHTHTHTRAHTHTQTNTHTHAHTHTHTQVKYVVS